MPTNALLNEKSPYLRQHAHNPVNWLPWGEQAFRKARDEQKPIFLSIGYSTCHWCHVMAHESFEDEQIAEVLNRDFVPVKVDREERPDVDRIYMLFRSGLDRERRVADVCLAYARPKAIFWRNVFPARLALRTAWFQGRSGTPAQVPGGGIVSRSSRPARK